MNDWDSTEGVLTVAEVAAVLRVTPQSVTRWAREGLIPAIRPGGGWRLSRAWLRRRLEDGSA